MLAYESFHRNALLSDSEGDLYSAPVLCWRIPSQDSVSSVLVPSNKVITLGWFTAVIILILLNDLHIYLLPSQDIWGQCCFGRLTCANQWSAAAPHGHVWLNGGPTACRAYHWEPVCPRVGFPQEKLVRSLLQITSKENHLQRMSISGTSPGNDLTSQGQRKIKMPK